MLEWNDFIENAMLQNNPNGRFWPKAATGLLN